APANGAHESSSFAAAGPHAEPAPVEAAPAPAPKLTGTLISDFTIDELADVLLGEGAPALGADVAPFGQVTQALLQPPSAAAKDFAVVGTRAETALPALARVLAYEEVADETLLAEVDAFTRLIEGAAAHYRFMFVPTWVLPSWVRGLGILEGRQGGSHRALL